MHATETLPLLPGEVGPRCATPPVLDRTETFPRALYEQTEAFARVVFPRIVDDPGLEAEGIEDLKTMILERPEDPYAGWTKARLYRRAKELGLPRRSTLAKAPLREALIRFEGR